MDKSAIWEKNCMLTGKLHEAKPSAISSVVNRP